MARWTESARDERHLAEIQQQLPIGGIVELELSDGTPLEGVLRHENLGNNGGDGGWRYYGECEVDRDGQRYVVDLLDCNSARSVWSEEKAREYEDLGLIERHR